MITVKYGVSSGATRCTDCQAPNYTLNSSKYRARARAREREKESEREKERERERAFLARSLSFSFRDIGPGGAAAKRVTVASTPAALLVAVAVPDL